MRDAFNRSAFPIGYGLFLALALCFVLLDAFVIPRAEYFAVDSAATTDGMWAAAEGLSADAGVKTAGTEPGSDMGIQTAGTQTAGTEPRTAGTEPISAAGTQTAGTEPDSTGVQPAGTQTNETQTADPQTAASVTPNSYRDEHIQITLQSLRAYDTNYYVVSFRLRP